MDMRTGQTYDTKAEALAAGVPESDLALLTGEMDGPEPPDVQFITSGPFKGRVYKRINGQMVRVQGGRGWIEKNDGRGNPIKVRR